jgi:glycosyltransferase involved in cell wall biosynthesis
MRVLLLGPYPPPYGGVQVNLLSIRGFLRERGIPCAVINLTRYRRVDGDGVFYPRSAVGLLRLLAGLRYEIIHLHIGGAISPRLLALCLCCCSIPGSRAVLTFHSGGYPSSPEGRKARRWSLRGVVFRRFDRVIAVNQEIADLMARYGLPRGKVRLIPPWSPPAYAAGAGLPANLEGFFARHAPVLLTVGLLEPEYDLPLQIEVLGGIRKRHPEAGLVIIGSGSLEEELRGAIPSKPYAEHVLLCGDVPHAETLAAIARCHLFLRTSLYDGDSLAVREALHFGTPVIASDNGMRPPGVLLVPPRDAGKLLLAVEAGLGRRQPRTAMEQGRRNEDNLEAVLDLYRELAPE